VKRILADYAEIGRDYFTYRDLLWQLILRDVKIRYKQAVMGFMWALFMPTLIVAAGLIVRLAIADSADAGFDLSGVGAIAARGVLWATFAAAVSFGTASLVGNSTLVAKIYFPREVLPVAAVFSNAFDGLIGGAVVAVVAPFLGARATLALIWVPVLVFLLLLLAIGVSLAFSAANLFFRDVKYIVQAVMTVGVLFTPVFYTSSDLGETGARIIAYNPLTPVLEGVRLAAFEGHNLLRPLLVDGVVAWSPWMLGYALALAVGGLLFASLVFHRAEGIFAERV
jgi:ABC-type polysaccharide/polyol phosphate export permease